MIQLVLAVAGCIVGCERAPDSRTAARSRTAIGPLVVHPDHPRYLADPSGRAIVLSGSHTWSNLQDMGDRDPPPSLDFEQYLDFLERHGHNFIRLWRWELPAFRYADEHGMRYASPHPWKRTGPDPALDGKPRFDVSQFDDSYFARLRIRVESAQKRGIYVGVMLFEGHGIQQTVEGWFSHPFNAANNINGIDGDTDRDGRGMEIHSLDPRMLAVQEAYVQEVLATLNDLDNVLFEIGNEMSPGPDCIDFQRHMIEFIHGVERELPKQHLVIASAPFGTWGDWMWETSAEVVSPGAKKVDGPRRPAAHGRAGTEARWPYRDDPPSNDGAKVVMLDTDHLWGCGGDEKWVWKAFTRGFHPIYMDPYLDRRSVCWPPNEQLRRNMGLVQRYAGLVNLAAMTPRGDLASTGFCLADPGRSYLVYLPDGGSVTVDLTATTGELAVEWFDAQRDAAIEGKSIQGDGIRKLDSPFRDDGVLWLRRSTRSPDSQVHR